MRLPATAMACRPTCCRSLVNEVTQIGLEAIAAAFAYGASAVRFLLRGKPRHDIAGLDQDHRACRRRSSPGSVTGSAATIETDDPDALGAALSVNRTAGLHVAAQQAFCL